MGAEFSVDAFGFKCHAKFKGDNVTSNQKIEGFFNLAGVEAASAICQQDAELGAYISKEHLCRPAYAAEIKGFVADLTNSQAEDLVDLMKKYEVAGSGSSQSAAF